MSHTVKCYVELVRYLLLDLKFSYVSTARFQTAPLEARFGKHRRLAGTNYPISVREIKASEKKLTLLSMLHVVSASKGTISFTNFVSQCADLTVVTPQIDVCSEFSDLYDMCDSVLITDSESKSLVFVAGYVGFMMVTNKVECSLCKSELLTDNNLQVDLVEE